MFKIDLLKGQGIPIKSRPESIAVASVTFAVPLIIAMMMLGYYLNGKIVISIQNKKLTNYQAKHNELSNVIEPQNALENKLKDTNSCLTEVAASVGRHSQWSTVLSEIVRIMPDSLVLTGLDVKQDSAIKRVSNPQKPEEKMNTIVPVRTLQMKVCGSSPTSYDQAVRDFQDRLRNSALLGPKLDNIAVSQGFEMLDGQEVVFYEINCIFKPKLKQISYAERL